MRDKHLKIFKEFPCLCYNNSNSMSVSSSFKMNFYMLQALPSMSFFISTSRGKSLVNKKKILSIFRATQLYFKHSSREWQWSKRNNNEIWLQHHFFLPSVVAEKKSHHNTHSKLFPTFIEWKWNSSDVH